MADETENPEGDTPKAESGDAPEAKTNPPEATNIDDTLDEFEAEDESANVPAEVDSDGTELLNQGGYKPDLLGEVSDLNAVYDIPVQLSAVLGRSTMQVSQLLKLGRGAVVELDRKVGEAIDIFVNNRLVARGEVVVVEDRLGVTMTEIIKADRVT